MRVRSITTCALGLAAALSFATTLAAQQDTTKLRRTTSDKRIAVSKGEVTPRPDTVYVTRYDTVRVNNTIVRVDTVTVVAPVQYVAPTIRGPMYWAIFGGTTWPWGNVDRIYTNGFHAGGAIGLESQDSPIGFRLDGAVSQVGREGGPSLNTGTGTPLMFHLAADVKAKALMFKGWAFYGVGGLNYNATKRIALAAASGSACNFSVRPGDCFTTAGSDWKSHFGFNLGLGTDFHIGNQDMFIEGRYFWIQANGARSTFIPMSIGVRYF